MISHPKPHKWWQDQHGEPQALEGDEGVLPECHAQGPRQGGCGDSFKSTFKEPCDITTQRSTNYEAIMLSPMQGSREATPSNNKEAPSDIATHYAEEGVKGDSKRCKLRLEGTTTMTIRDDSHDWEVGGSGVRHMSIDARSGKHSSRVPIDHFKRLLEEAFPNHAYFVRHKLKDCNVMRSFMTLGSLTWGLELNEGPNESDTSPFDEENTVMTVYGGRPLQEGATCLAQAAGPVIPSFYAKTEYSSYA
jgi:hypothetical protein